MDDKLELLLSGQQYKKLQEFWYGRVLEEYQLNIVDVRVLLFLDEHKKFDTAKDIVEMHYLTKSYVSKSIDKLIAKGFLERKHLSDDRRYVHLLVREEALPVIKAVRDRKETMVRQIFQGITSDQKEVLMQVATKINENIAGVLR
ncbi:MAG: MarR family transcriptional regulator [Butyribacter sp.]|nr:MarR family transcriptional regulator [bacterium]MDY3854241.1 MarR family transcriptional regulator [Butyribacter sp.]